MRVDISDQVTGIKLCLKDPKIMLFWASLCFSAKNLKKLAFIAFLVYNFLKIRHHFHLWGWKNVK